MSYSFALKREHLQLLPDLVFEARFNTVYGDEVIPEINPKRPFGNSAVTYDVCQRLQFKQNEDGEFSCDDKLRAMHIIAELPFALAYVLRTHNFEPGTYELDENVYSTEIFRLRMAKNYLAVYPALLEIRRTGIDEDLFRRIQEMFSSNCSHEPFRDIAFLEACLDKGPVDGLEGAIQILKKHRTAYEKASRAGQSAQKTG